MPQNTPPQRSALSRSTIVDAAVAIADNEGVKKLSMRKLAAALGYEVMSLYNHVKNKNELMVGMLEAVAAEVVEPELDASTTEPLVAIRAFAVSYHDMFLRHPWAPELWLSHLPGPVRTGLMELLLALLDAADLSDDVAHFGFHAITNHVVGHSMQQIGMTVGMDDPERVINEFLAGLDSDEQPHMIKHIHQHMAGETGESFELVLDLILDGLVGMTSA